MAKVKCGICGGVKANYERYSECAERRIMKEEGLCFGCAFWRNMQVEKWNEKKTSVIVDGVCFEVGPEKTGASGDRGFAGRRFRIRFNDGRDVVTTNLWHCGDMPDWLKKEWPDNARWVVDAIEVANQALDEIRKGVPS